ncbi:P-loop containing nucleoside triphosphate hydrolase protein [Durotheca rogersii]|uniref:P-loop containing nucleoside triphosphate hydrolase protein n=1 Tax=Durotheca rogersii TaxID=419775 RepID=UPI00221F8E74|nr:P-loop containing nucleoside triphosphate hydrolase protein [Durotheca rogersii]KAI5863362.1 P-loop containing nucleoside triphosphate hydrolase protein [Durotheca rogersii]
MATNTSWYLALLAALGAVLAANLSHLRAIPFPRWRRVGSLFARRPRGLETAPEAAPHGAAAAAAAAPPLILLVLGAPGVGKGTASAALRAALPGATHLSYGDLARYHDGIPGSWVSSFPRRAGARGGPLLPARAGARLVCDAVRAGVARGQAVWVVDGFPRSRDHVAAWAAARLPPPACALYLHCPPETSCARVRGRAGASGRPDDADPAGVRERVARARADSEAMLRALEDADVPVVWVDAARDLDAVTRELAKEKWEAEHPFASLPPDYITA